MKGKIATILLSFLITSLFQFGTPFLSQSAPLKTANSITATCDGPCSPIHLFVTVSCDGDHCFKQHKRNSEGSFCNITGDANAPNCTNGLIEKSYNKRFALIKDEPKNNYTLTIKDHKKILTTQKIE